MSAFWTSVVPSVRISGGIGKFCVIARTRKGHGVDMMEKQPQAWHLGLLTAEQQADVVAEITARMELAAGSSQ